MIDRGASDVYFRIKAVPHARINGKIEPIADTSATKADVNKYADILLATDQRRAQFKENLDIDFIHEEPGVGRFRVNIFIQRGTPAIVCRHVSYLVKDFADLNLPVELCKLFSEQSNGLFLVCGPAGNGKSTTIASMIEYINVNQKKHVITIEDPIEYLFNDKNSLISQRELGIDVPSFPSALKHITQQSPDIMYIGNIRDVETMRAAINATELGTFVMTTFHTINAVQSIIRIVNFFPPYLHDEVRMQLSMILRGTISLRLVPLKDGNGRVPAYESMVVTPSIARLIREGTIREIQEYIDEGEMFGMQSFKKSLVKLVKEGLVTEEDAIEHADSRDDFILALKGIKRISD